MFADADSLFPSLELVVTQEGFTPRLPKSKQNPSFKRPNLGEWISHIKQMWWSGQWGKKKKKSHKLAFTSFLNSGSDVSATCWHIFRVSKVKNIDIIVLEKKKQVHWRDELGQLCLHFICIRNVLLNAVTFSCFIFLVWIFHFR